MLTALGIAGDADATRRSSNRSTTWSSRSSTTSTCASSPPRGAGAPAFDRVEALRAGPPGRRRPAGPCSSRPARAARRGVRLALRDGRARARSSAASVRGGCTPTTTCSPGCTTRSPTPSRGGGRSGCGPATGWCSSTSSRTPTRVQWGILRAPSTGTCRWSSSATPSRRSTPSAARTSSAYLDAVRQADDHATLARNWRSDAGAATRPGHRVRRRRAGRPADRRAAGGVGPPGAAARRRAGRRSAAAAGAAARRADRAADAASAHRGGPAARSPRDVAADVAALLASGATVDGRRRCGPATSRCSSARNDQGTLVRDALAAAGVPAVLSGTASVFAHPRRAASG